MEFTIPPDLIRGPESEYLPLVGEANWGMNVFGVEKLRSITRGEGITVGVIDTGIDDAHPLLTNVKAAKDFTGSPNGYRDVNQHGTHCSGTVGAQNEQIGVAPGCQIVHGKALSDQGSGYGTWIRDAMQWCVDQGATVLSMSLGSPGEDPTITTKIRQLADQGVWIIAAAGNSGAGTPNVDWPGRSAHAISVAALTQFLNPASFTSAGAKIDTSGPGVDIWSTKPGGGYRQMSGTSMATPFVAGVLALYRAALVKKQLPVPFVEALRLMLFADSTDTHLPGDDNRTGPGWITPLLLALNLQPDPPPVG